MIIIIISLAFQFHPPQDPSTSADMRRSRPKDSDSSATCSEISNRQGKRHSSAELSGSAATTPRPRAPQLMRRDGWVKPPFSAIQDLPWSHGLGLRLKNVGNGSLKLESFAGKTSTNINKHTLWTLFGSFLEFLTFGHAKSTSSLGTVWQPKQSQHSMDLRDNLQKTLFLFTFSYQKIVLFAKLHIPLQPLLEITHSTD